MLALEKSANKSGPWFTDVFPLFTTHSQCHAIAGTWACIAAKKHSQAATVPYDLEVH